MTDPAPLSTFELGRRYRSSQPWALRQATIELTGGSIYALVGPNGAGKSTLLRCCIGFETPDAGHALVRGIDPRRDRAGAVANVGFVPQASSMYRDLTVEDHFAFAAAHRRRFDRPYAVRRMQDVGVSLGQRVGELSGGEQAQVALAMALAVHAPLLLLDEPMASLDPLARREFLTALVEEVRTSGAAALLSSHIITDVEQACDVVIVLAGGRIVLNSSVDGARREHRTGHPAAIHADELVGTFLDPTGRPIALGRTDDADLNPATLEEVVLGYLASGRPASAAVA